MLDILNQGLSIILSNLIGRWAFAVIGGLCLAFSLAGYGLSFLAWIALIPLFLLIKSSNSIKGSIFDGLIYFICFNAASFLWLVALHPLTWQGLSQQESLLVSSLAWLTPSISHSLILIPFCIVLKLLFMYRADERSFELKFLDITFLSFLWVIIEYKFLLNLGDGLKSFFVPINLVAYSQYENLYFIQIANAVGAIGIEFFIVFVNLLISNLFNVHQVYDSNNVFGSGLNVKRQFFGIERASSDYVNVFSVVFTLILGAYYYGYNNIKNYNETRLATPLKKVAILQADYSAKATRTSDGFDKLIQMQSNLSQSISKEMDFLFWTEGAIPSTQHNTKALFKSLEGKTKNFSFGTFIHKDDKTYNALTNYSFKTDLVDKPVLRDLSQVSEELESPEIQIQAIRKVKAEIQKDSYLKNLLVPFGEYTPFYDKLPMNLKLLAQSSIGSGFDSSKEIKNIITPHGNYAPSICFEILFPEFIRKFINKDTDFMVNVNDLSWFKNKVSIFGIELGFLKGFSQRMMLAAATFRAVENNKDLVLASNAGISAVIQSTGAREKQTKVNNIELLEDKLLSNRANLSIYTRYGW